MLFAKEILPRAQRACTFDISADRNVWLQPALRSFAIVCDYMETALFAIVCDLRSEIVCDRLRSYGNQPLVESGCVVENNGKKRLVLDLSYVNNTCALLCAGCRYVFLRSEKWVLSC